MTISIFLGFDIIKCVFDTNITSQPSILRERAFECANELLSYKQNTEVVIEGSIFARFEDKLTEDHIKAFNELYDIDNSALNVKGYDYVTAIDFIIINNKLPLDNSFVILLTDEKSKYSNLEDNKNVVILDTEEFLLRFKKFEQLKNKLSSVSDAIITSFFYWIYLNNFNLLLKQYNNTTP